MGRPRKPTNVLHLNGAFKHDPQRLTARANEPKPAGPIGSPPAWMQESEQRAWHEIVEEALPGVLSNADRGTLSIAAQLRALQTPGEVDLKAMSLLKACYTELGMTPASRSKVQATPVVTEPNAFAAV
jgi:hypothetical protein